MSKKEKFFLLISRKGSIKPEIYVLLVSLVVPFAALEILFRIFIHADNAKPIRADKPVNWYLPESSTDNRDATYPEEKAAGVFRVIVVGDSFTYGGKVQYDDTFPKRLERMLNLNNKQRKVEVLNWGIPGYSTVQEGTLVQRAVKYYHPDLIILQITLNDAEREPFRVSHSKSFKFRDAIEKSNILHHWKSLGYLIRRFQLTMMEKEYIQYHKDLFFDTDTYDRFEMGLREINRLTKEYKVPLFAAVFPFFSHPIGDKYIFSDVHEKISMALEKLGINHLDLQKFYKGIEPSRLQIFPGEDAHPNEIAYRIAADAIYEGLLDGKFLPEDVKIKKISSKGRKLLKPLPAVTKDQ